MDIGRPSLSLALETLLKNANFIKPNEKDYFVLLNDRHGTHRTDGGKRWYEAKIQERQGGERSSIDKRISRATENFLTKVQKQPHFLRKLDEKNQVELSDTLDQFRANGNGRTFPLYKIEDKDYVYVEATDEDVKNNIRAFRLNKTNANATSATDTSTSTSNCGGEDTRTRTRTRTFPKQKQGVGALPSHLVDPEDTIVSMSVNDLARFLGLIETGKLSSKDALKEIRSRFSNCCTLRNDHDHDNEHEHELKKVASIPTEPPIIDSEAPSRPTTTLLNNTEYMCTTTSTTKRKFTYNEVPSSVDLSSSSRKRMCTEADFNNGTGSVIGIGMSSTGISASEHYPTSDTTTEQGIDNLDWQDDGISWSLKTLDDTSSLGAHSLSPRGDDNEYKSQGQHEELSFPQDIFIDSTPDSLKPNTY